MEIKSLFPTEIFIFQSEIDTGEIIKTINDKNILMSVGHVLSSKDSLHDKSEFKQLFDWFHECLNDIKIYNKYDCDRFEISSSWYNRSTARGGMHINYHRHSMSFLSGIFYLTDGAPTIFEDPVTHRTQSQIEVLRHDYQPFEHIIPEPGKLVIFPSWMYHCGWAHNDDYDRIIISFNSLPSGKINYNLARDSKANINIL